MKAVILCAGYGTRLYPLTKNKAKPLLNVFGKPILDYILGKVLEIQGVDEVFITTNRKFHKDFEVWKKSKRKNLRNKIRLVKNSFFSFMNRSGGVNTLFKIIKTEKLEEDVLVIGGDNLFDFSLKGFVNFFKKKKKVCLVLNRLKKKSDAKRFGVAVVRGDEIISFQEKPQKPKSNLISTAIYIIPRWSFESVGAYLRTGPKKNSFGHLINFLHKHEEVYGYTAKGRFIDIGTIEDYEMANRSWRKR